MRTSPFSTFGLAVLCALGLAACGLQGEGERCDRTNGNDDCESGLRCTPQASINGADTRAAICCPDGRAATVDACRVTNVGGSTGGSGGSGGASADAAVGSGGTEAGADASTGTRPDAALDGAP